MKTQREAKDSFAKRRPRLFLLIVTTGFVGILALIFVPSFLAYMTASSALARMNVRVVSAGGVAIDEPQTLYGGIWWFQNLCMDTPCPTIKQDFLVPLEVGREGEFMSQELLASQGYSMNSSQECQIEKPGVLCLQSGSNGSASVFMVLDPVAKQPEHIPNRDVLPKVWRTLSIQSYPSN